MPSLSEEIAQLLHESQSNVHSHQRLLKTLGSLHEKHDLELFFEAFFRPFSNVLVVYKREPTALRVIEFVAKFAMSTAPRQPEGDESESDSEVEASFFSLLLEKLLSLHDAQWKGVRFRVCQLVSRLLTLANEAGCAVGARLLGRVECTMLERVLDKVPIVRLHAVMALEWLQQPDEECPDPVSAKFLSLLATDPSPDVRRCVLNKIALYDGSLLALIERTRDVKEVIRREAYLRLEGCSIRNFRIQQRIQLLSDGLNDESELVQEACVNGLLRKWILESNDGDFITLLHRLDVESSSEVAGLALWKLFDNFSVTDLVSSMVGMITNSYSKPEVWDDHTPTRSLSIMPSRGSSSNTPSARDNEATPTTANTTPKSLKVISMDDLQCEEAFYWSHLCRYIHSKGGGMEDYLEQIVPTMSEFCTYLQRYVEEVLMAGVDTEQSLKCQFVVQQLCAMLPVLDQSDEVGRRRLGKLVCDLLGNSSFPTPLISHLLSQQIKVWPQESHRVEVLTEVIADLRQAFNVTMDNTLNATATSFSQMSTQLDPKEDAGTLLRCLTISCELLKELQPQALSSTLRMLKDALLIPCVQNESPFVRDMALLCLGLLSLLDVGTAREHLLLFVQVSQVDHESVQATALKIVFDLLHVYGFETFNIIAEEGRGSSSEEVNADELDSAHDSGEASEAGDSSEAEKSDGTMQRLLNIMLHFLEGESSLLSQVAAEGIAKLLLSRRVLSQKLLAKLLVLWYNPVFQEEGRLRAVLGAFFPLFAASDRSCRECLGEVYLPVLSSVFEAPPTSPLYEIDAANMADFIIYLTQPSQPDEECIHDNLAFAVCNAVLSDPTSSDVRVFTRSLSQMTFSAANQANAAGLLELGEQMSKEVTDKIALKYIDKLRESLRLISPARDAVETGGSSVEQQEESRVLCETSENVMTTPINQKQPKRTRKPQAKTTVKKAPSAVARVTRTTVKKSRRNRRKKPVKEEELSSEEIEIESENLEPAAPTRAKSVRESKMVAAKKMKEEELEVLEDSDDSLVGEHSPFIRHTAAKTRHLSRSPLSSLQYEED